MAMAPISLPAGLRFGPFKVGAQVFHLSPSRLSFGLVNLKPLLPGHILVCPVRPVPRLSQLTAEETSDLFLTVRRISRTLERLYQADALNVAVQDGVEAGQSVPHVHVHVIPRTRSDMDSQGGGDKLYDMMDGDEGNLGQQFFAMMKRRQEKAAEQKEFGGPDAEASRQPRADEDMKQEAEWLRTELEKDSNLDYAVSVSRKE